MTVKEKIKSLLDEASVYIKHGLYEEAKNNYKAVFLLLEKNKTIPNRQLLIAGIKKKILAINKKTEELEKIASVSELSTKARDVIKTKVFSFSANGNGRDDVDSALDGGINLARFGQFEEALKEFRQLFPLEPIRVEAAKNMMRCFMGLNDLEGAVDCYRQWREKKQISDSQSREIFDYILNIPDKNGVRKELIDLLEAVDKPAPELVPEVFSDELEFSDLSSDVLGDKSEDEQFNENGFGSEFSDDLLFEDMGVEDEIDSQAPAAGEEPPDLEIELEEPAASQEPPEKDEISINGMVLEMEKDSAPGAEGSPEIPDGARYVDYVKVSGNPQSLIPDEEVIEINSIGINIITGERAGEEINLDVITQNGNQVSIIVPLSEDALLNCLDVGNQINDIMCYSPIAIFSGFGIVTSKMVINSGPQKGNFGVDLRLKVE